MKISKAYDNVFEALEDDVSVAGNLKLRGRLMTEIRRFIDKRGLSRTRRPGSWALPSRGCPI